MRFMTMVKSLESSGPPPQELIDAIAKLGEETGKAGIMVETGGLAPTATGALVRLADGKLTVTDGPFGEAKEVVGGYAIFELDSKEEAIEQAKRFLEVHRKHWKGWEGEIEVRQVFGPDEGPPARR